MLLDTIFTPPFLILAQSLIELLGLEMFCEVDSCIDECVDHKHKNDKEHDRTNIGELEPVKDVSRKKQNPVDHKKLDDTTQ
jgi:hypothetical protein